MLGVDGIKSQVLEPPRTDNGAGPNDTLHLLLDGGWWKVTSACVLSTAVHVSPLVSCIRTMSGYLVRWETVYILTSETFTSLPYSSSPPLTDRSPGHPLGPSNTHRIANEALRGGREPNPGLDFQSTVEFTARETMGDTSGGSRKSMNEYRPKR